jgi:tRNA pseudouridine(55) synthase
MEKPILLYKQKGETPLECLERFRAGNIEEYAGVKMTYAGRLDPLAEGILPILAGEACKNKDQYLNLEKTYEYEILFGPMTDTGDILGLVTDVQEVPKEFLLDGFKNFVLDYTGTLKQMYPNYSAKTVRGIPLFDWAKRLEVVERPVREVSVFEHIFFNEEKTFTTDELKVEILKNVSLVHGDFRQEAIMQKWEEVLGEKKDTVWQIGKCVVRVSSGFYVRVIPEKIFEIFGVPSVVWSIKRVTLGEWGVEDCIS